MNMNQYQEASRRTMTFAGTPKTHENFNNFLSEYAMGLTGEVIEAYALHTAVPLLEDETAELKRELGDISHYAVGLAALINFDLPDHIEIEYEDEDIPTCEIFDKLIAEAGLILEHAKKVVHHKHAFDKSQIDVLEVLALVKTIARAYGFKYTDVLATNIEKTKVRYPNGFTQEDSIARAEI